MDIGRAYGNKYFYKYWVCWNLTELTYSVPSESQILCVYFLAYVAEGAKAPRSKFRKVRRARITVAFEGKIPLMFAALTYRWFWCQRQTLNSDDGILPWFWSHSHSWHLRWCRPYQWRLPLWTSMNTSKQASQLEIRQKGPFMRLLDGEYGEVKLNWKCCTDIWTPTILMKSVRQPFQ